MLVEKIGTEDGVMLREAALGVNTPEFCPAIPAEVRGGSGLLRTGGGAVVVVGLGRVAVLAKAGEELESTLAITIKPAKAMNNEGFITGDVVELIKY